MEVPPGPPLPRPSSTVGYGNEGVGIAFLRLDIASAPLASPGHAFGTVVGGIDACSGLPAPKSYVAGTVDAIMGRTSQARVSPTKPMATRIVPAGGQYRFVLAVGNYVLDAFRNDQGSNTDRSSVSVTVLAGKTVQADIPNNCI